MPHHHAKPIVGRDLLPLALSVFAMLGGGYASAETVTKTLDNKKANDPPIGSPAYHLIKTGDTLYAVGLSSGHGYQNLAKWNHLATPYRIIVGQTLKLSPPTTKSQRPDKRDPLDATKSNLHRQSAMDPTKNTPTRIPITVKKSDAKDKKSIISIDNKKMLKLSFNWPIKGSVLKNFAQSGKQGIDIENKISKQPVLAAESGRIVYVGQDLKGFRNLIIIKHNHGYLSAYANTGKVIAKEGRQVAKNQAVAHLDVVANQRSVLHFEIRKNGNPINPTQLLPNNP